MVDAFIKRHPTISLCQHECKSIIFCEGYSKIHVYSSFKEQVVTENHTDDLHIYNVDEYHFTVQKEMPKVIGNKEKIK
jgi:hypothetical protein